MFVIRFDFPLVNKTDSKSYTKIYLYNFYSYIKYVYKKNNCITTRKSVAG
ncbi:hypothetical protein VIBNIAM115_60028 [Vibrio nigripulchritudo AM115]|nr:hypothetical protein VIBNIAM115_60028 [Vibrio nigripulchritudo AM115]